MIEWSLLAVNVAFIALGFFAFARTREDIDFLWKEVQCQRKKLNELSEFALKHDHHVIYHDDRTGGPVSFKD